MRLLTRNSDYLAILIYIFVYITIALGKNIEELRINMGISIRLSHIVLLVAIMMAPEFFVVGWRVKKIRWVYFLLVTGIISVLVGFSNDEPLNILASGFGIFLYPLFFAIGYYCLCTIERLSIFCRVVLLGWLSGALFFIARQYSLTGVLPFGIHLSSDVVPLASGAIAGFIIGKGIKNYSSLLLLAAVVGFMLLVGTRALLIMTIILCIMRYYFFVKVKGHKKTHWMVFVVLILLIYLFCIFVASFYLDDLLNNLQGRAVSDTYRLLIFMDMSKLIIESPILGHGIASFIPPQVSYFMPDLDAGSVNVHNSYMQMLFYAGIFGLLPMLYLLSSMRFYIYNFENKESRLIKSASWGVLSVSLVATTTPVWELHYIAPLLWLALGSLQANNRYALDLAFSRV